MTRATMILLLAVGAHTAAAQSPNTPISQATAAFDRGRALMAEGKFDEACAEFAHSQALAPAPTTQLNLGGCHEKAERLATAWKIFAEVDLQLRNATDPVLQQLGQIASKRVADLLPRLSKLTIKVTPMPGLEVLRDNTAVPASEWNRAVEVDGGTVKIEARAPGREPWSTTITIARERDNSTVVIPPLQPSAAAPTSTTTTRTTDVTFVRRHRTSLVLGGGAVLLLGGALGAHLSGNSLYDDAKAEMEDNARRQSLRDDANKRRYAAQGLAAAGVACAGVAVWLAVRGGGAKPTAREVAIAPIVSGGEAGLLVTGRY